MKINYVRQFGGKVTPALKERYAQSSQWNGKAFENPLETKVDFNLSDIPKMMHERFCTNASREPEGTLDCVPLDVDAFLSPSDTAKMIWFGHSAVLLRIAGETIFIDPMMGANASPIAPFKTRRFTGELLEVLRQLPSVDKVLLTHDHYDHLDLESIDLLRPKTAEFITAVGVGRHLVQWGVAADDIVELDWWGEKSSAELNITFTPSRHSSGRAIRDQSCTLWGGWVLDSGSEKIYFTGDGGYGPHFKEVGERLGPFDLGFVECGQYNDKWRVIHLHPDESVQASIDAGIRKSVPVHWGAFALAMHDWQEPPQRFTKEARAQQVNYTLPRIGEMFGVEHGVEEEWWECQ